MGQGKVELPLDESGDEGEEEVYDPDYEEEDEHQKHESSQVLNRSKPGVALNPVNEEVKEMKSVDEETNKDDSDAFPQRELLYIWCIWGKIKPARYQRCHYSQKRWRLLRTERAVF